jgi:hypothetical protein
MIAIINLFYLLLFFGISAVGLYICYHILRYSLSKKSALTVVTLFAGIFLLFLCTNAVLFSQIDWGTLLRNPAGVTSFPVPFSNH